MFKFKYGILGKQNKYDSYGYYYKSLQNRINTIFKYDGLPNTISEDFLNNNLINLGYSAFFQIDGKLYTGWGGLGGEQTHEYKPSVFTFSNPRLGSHIFKINQIDPEEDDAIVMFNTMADEQFINFTDASDGGYSRLLHQSATLLTDNLLSINMAQINGRVQAVFTCENQHQKNAAKEVLKRLYNGEPYEVILSDDLEPFTVNPVSNNASNEISRLIEVHQHIISEFYNEIGIPMTPYFKKERLISDEVNGYSNISNSILFSLYSSRFRAIRKINERFGTDISVDYNDWVKELIEDNVENYGEDEDSTVKTEDPKVEESENPLYTGDEEKQASDEKQEEPEPEPEQKEKQEEDKEEKKDE